MPNVNLIAVRRAEKKRLEAWTRYLFFALASSVGLFFVLALFLATQRTLLSSQLSDAQQKLAKLKPQLVNIEKIEAKTKELSPKVKTLELAKAGTERYRYLFYFVSKAVPSNVWLTSIATSGDPPDMNTTVTLNGVATSQTDVATMMERLQTVSKIGPLVAPTVAATPPNGGTGTPGTPPTGSATTGTGGTGTAATAPGTDKPAEEATLFDNMTVSTSSNSTPDDKNKQPQITFEIKAHLRPPVAASEESADKQPANGKPTNGQPTSGTPANGQPSAPPSAQKTALHIASGADGRQHPHTSEGEAHGRI